MKGAEIRKLKTDEQETENRQGIKRLLQAKFHFTS
jgi:hypothetical protein